LRGDDGVRRILRDARGRVLEAADLEDRPLRDGERVELALDVVAQLYAEQALEELAREWKPKSCCAVVMDPTTSDVLAMASWPTFDPNEPAGIPDAAWKNRTLADMYEPGSTFKPFVVAWGMRQGLLRRDEVFDCENGEYRMGRRVLHDHHRYGALDVTDILVKSSNIGMAKIGERMGNAGLYEAASSFGFGAPTGIGLPGELGGKLRPLADWNGYSTGSVPMGQEIAVTPLQMAAAYCALANGGEWRTPRLILGGERLAAHGLGSLGDTAGDAAGDAVGIRDLPAEDEMAAGEAASDDLADTMPDSRSVETAIRDLAEGEALPLEESVVEREVPAVETPVVPEGGRAAHGSGLVSRVVEPEVARWICRVPLAEVVTRGTGKKARLATYRVFGKSGTAQKPDPATGAYSNRLHVSSFVCGAPADRPRVIVVVSVDEPSTAGEHFGGTVAAPAAARILERTLELLGVPPGDPGPVASVDDDVTAD
jgi:cell division protein FtsI/penicillin-binding protein 2